MRAPANSGGVAILMKSEYLNDYVLNVVDSNSDGVLALELKHKTTGYSMLIITCSLPPSNSTWGRDATHFYAHVLSIIYMFSHCDMTIICDDLNSRFGMKKDFIPDIDEINDRTVLDKEDNYHGNALIEFLLDSKCCVVNGRITPEYDNFTCIRTFGKSVVDYFIIPHDCINNCSSFKVHLAKDLIEPSIFGANGIPDHSVLELKIQLSAYGILSQSIPVRKHDSIAQNRGSTDGTEHDRYYKRYKMKDIPLEFLNNDTAKIALDRVIANIESCLGNQSSIDNVYEHFCQVYHNEMKKFLKMSNINPVAPKKLRHSLKPFWNEALQILWNEVRAKENEFLSCHDNTRTQKRNLF